MKTFFLRLVAVALTTAGLIWLWINAPNLIVAGFDTNLAIIKFAASLVPAPYENYGAMGEVALRGLGADRALIFAEGTVVVKLAFWLFARPFRRSSQNVNQKEV